MGWNYFIMCQNRHLPFPKYRLQCLSSLIMVFFHSLSLLHSLPFFLFFLNLVPPTIKSSGLSERTVVKYKPITLQCIANGIPNPSITWLKDGQPVNTAQGNLKVSMNTTLPKMRKLYRELSHSPFLIVDLPVGQIFAGGLLKQYVYFLESFRL